MSTQTITSDLLEDLSTAQQQLLSGGQTMGLDEDDSGENGVEGEGVSRGTNNRPRRYRINSTSIITIRRLS